ncbi:sugar-binding transcriptional regulator [Christensenella timonensis]|uniref:sugar-binding transcriptional regulator n=1 Tax=Christensenella timonensis TaxID=1816678 RepID=UPI0008367FC8|nr:sugar-binding domain-containing protein [Christensenella timonensis]
MKEQERYAIKLEATRLYYLEDIPQKEIAERLNISRPTLTKFLKEAKQEGIVKIEVCDIQKLNEFMEIENELKQKLGLREVKIVDAVSDNSEEIMNGIAQYATQYIQQFIKSNMRIGVGWGKTLEVIAKNMVSAKNIRNVTFMPILGGPGKADHCSMFANILCEHIASNYSGSMVDYVYAPLFAGNAAMKEAYVNLPNIKSTLEKFDELDMAITAIDGDLEHSMTLKVENASGETRRQLAESNVVGSMCARFYDIEGNERITEMTERIVAISLEQIRKTPLVIATGGGSHKVGSIIGGARTHIFNILVTDIYTAEKILNFLNKEN